MAKTVIAGRYQVECALGEGGMGVTLLAVDQLLGRRVVVKRPKSEEIYDWFAKEAKAQAAVNHTNVVKVFDYGLHDGKPFLVMEWIAGWSLDRLIKCAGKLSPERAAYIITTIGQAVAHAHVFGLIHRDIKPHNILIGSDDIPRLADFGIAKLPSQPMTVAGHGIGTPAYAAPEQLQDAKNVDCRADIYALGMTLLSMLAGQLSPHPSVIATIPADFHPVLGRCLQIEPKNRFPSAEAFLEALPPFRHHGPRPMASNMVGTAQALKTMHLKGAKPARKRDHVELLFNLGEVRMSGTGKLRTIVGHCYSQAKEAAGYVVWLHEEKAFDVKRATKAVTEYSPSIAVDEEVIASLVSLEDASA